MKNAKLILTGIAGLVILALATPTFAADEKDAGKGKEGRERTITGEGKCAKCALKEGDKCQNVIEVEGKNGKKAVKFYLVDNEMAKDFHKNVCKENKKVTATGTVKKVDGKNEMTVTKIEVVKE
jgi:RecG-like helicase